MNNQIQRTPMQMFYEYGAFHYPNGQQKTETCDFWTRGQCRFAPIICYNAHGFFLEDVSGGVHPPRHRPTPYHNHQRHEQMMRAYYAYMRNRAGRDHVSATGENMLPLNAAPFLRSQLDRIANTSPLSTPMHNPANGTTTGQALPNQRPHPEHSSGMPFNPAAAPFRSVLQPNREAEYKNKSEKLLRALDEQNAVIVAIQEELVNVADEIACAVKDMRDVAKTMQQGQINVTTSIKKLAYRSADLENIMKRQEDWRVRLAQVTMPDVSRA
ncbi:hypothetical protein MMC11_003264 [Xylographa trunciseda]|nr:hypothetical protein [Xylographa trunciseda]